MTVITDTLDPYRAGTAMVGVAIVGLVASLAVGILGWRAVGEVSTGVEASLVVSEDALAAIDDTILVAGNTVGTVGRGIATIGASLDVAQSTLVNVSSLFAQSATIAAGDLPDSIASVRSALPPLIDSAALVTEALGAISVFGVDVAPPQPIDTPLRAIDADLLQLESQLRGQSGLLTRVSEDFASFSTTAANLQIDLAAIDHDLAEANAILTGYERTASGARSAVVSTRAQLDRATTTSRALIVTIAVLFAAAQAAPLYAGHVLRSAGRARADRLSTVA